MEKLGLMGKAGVYCILGAIFFLVSLGYFFAPGLMNKLNEIGRKILWRDKWTITHRIFTGIAFLVVALVFIWVGIYLGRR